MIVDSCVLPDGKTPAGIAYLESIGVNLREQVKIVAVTHWDSDHIRGVAETFKQCDNAVFICPGALLQKDFVALTQLWSRDAKAESPLKEFTEVLSHLFKSDRLLRSSTGAPRLRYSGQDKRLWHRPPTILNGFDLSGQLVSLSPSDVAQSKSHAAITSLFPSGPILKKPQTPKPNLFSTVLWLKIGPLCCLLGADMEELDNPYGGWSLIVDSSTWSADGSLFKIPHHGSSNGECAAVWEKMLIKNPTSLIAPFSRGVTPLPTKDDKTRICGNTNNAYLTAVDRARSSRRKNDRVDEMILGVVKSIRKVNDSYGLVRARRKLDPAVTEWSVETFGDAHRLIK